MQTRFTKTLITILSIFALSFSVGFAQTQSFLNVSYDIARELFESYNVLFLEYWAAQGGAAIDISQSHAGSSRQAQAILEGLNADVVTFNQVTDVDVLHERGNLIPEDWRNRLPNDSSPYYSTTAFLVRAGNPKNIQNWDDLLRDDVSLVFPNPKTSGNGRYTYLAALGFAQQAFGDDQAAVDAFMRSFLAQVAVFDTGGRAATITFVEREIGDVLITFEAEVNNIRAEFAAGGYEVVVPAVSIYAEFPVTWIDANVARNGTEELAQAYLEHLYSDEAQRLLAGFYYRLYNEEIQAEFADLLPEVTLLTVEEITGGWANAMTEHFADGGRLDALLRR